MKALFAAATLVAASLAGVAVAQNDPAQPPYSAAQPPPEAQPPEEPAPPPGMDQPPSAAQPMPEAPPTPEAPAPQQQSSMPQPAQTTAWSDTSRDAKSTYSEAQVRGPRRAYRAACQRYESRSFCDCVTAGVAQALPPDKVRMAARSIGERITAQGSAPAGGQTDAPHQPGESAQDRIAQVEGHYADACHKLRK